MHYPLSEWLNLVLRWLHVVAGIFWLGQTALFTWLDARLTVEARGSQEQVWLVHSGGFYRVEKERQPPALPPLLHWFKWEALLTWVTGFLLFVHLYYLGGALQPADGRIGRGAAIGLSLGLLVVGWLVYDLLWRSPLARRHEGLCGALSFVLIVSLAYGCAQVLNGRAAYLEVGAVLGTVMTANVWLRILPAQGRMVRSVAAGQAPDVALAAGAKQRSKHNTFLAIPVVLIMISNHFPVATYGNRWNWLVLAGLVLVGFGARKTINLYEARPPR